MAFDPTKLIHWDTGGLVSIQPPLSVGGSPVAPSVWIYKSSDSSTDISAAAYFLQAGYPQAGRLNAPSAVGVGIAMRVGDLVVNVPSTNATTPRATVHLVLSSTPNIATSASSFYYAVWNASVSAGTA